MAGAVQTLFHPRQLDRDGWQDRFRDGAKTHRPVLRASMCMEGGGEIVLNATLALLYLGDDNDVKADFAPLSAGLHQLQRALAADAATTRLSGARAIAHLLTERLKIDLQVPGDRDGAGALGTGTGDMHSFAPAFGSEEDSDVCFEVEGRALPAHRVLLKMSLGTDVFAVMLSHDTADARTGRVSVMGVSFEVFSLVIKFLYTGKADVPPPLLPNVFRAARRWMVTKLMALCATRLGAQLSTDRWDGVWEVIELVAEEPSGFAPELLQLLAARFMLQHVEALVEQPCFVKRRVEIAQMLVEHAYPLLAKSAG